MSSLDSVNALASTGAVKRANSEKVADVESDKEDESGRVWVLGLKGMRVLGEEVVDDGGGDWWSLAVVGALRAISTADQLKFGCEGK